MRRTSRSTLDWRPVSNAIGTQVPRTNWSSGPRENAGLRGLASNPPEPPRAGPRPGAELVRCGPGVDGIMGRLWRILKTVISGFLANDALSRGAAIAFYAATSLAPVLLIVVAIAGLVFGKDAARAAISEELGQLLGPAGGDFIKSILERSSDLGSGILATILGVVTILITASGVFGEMQTALNKTFKARPSDEPISALIRTRAASLGLVAALGFMLVVSLAASAGLSALGNWFQGFLAGKILLAVLNTVVSLAIFTLLFTAIYKVLPDTAIPWRDLVLGAVVTAVLFTVGKSLIGVYLGRAAPSSPYGAAGALIVLMFWTYYSAQIFLFGAELTKAIADERAPIAEFETKSLTKHEQV
jgi:membrane protein